MNRLTDKRLLHEINIPEEAGKQCAESEEHANTVWAEGGASRHSARDERRPKSHQDARDDAGNDAFLGDGAVYAGKVAVGFAVEHDGDHRAEYTSGEHAGMPLRLQNVAGHNTYDQRDT